jgi:hypothetical protein
MMKPLYGTKEAGTYWSAAHSGDWKQKFGVNPSKLDPCFMTATCNQAKAAPHGIVAILVDDTLRTGKQQFAKATERMHSNYDMKQTQIVTNDSQIKFGRVKIGRDPEGTLGTYQQAYIEILSNTEAVLHNDIASVLTARRKISRISTWTCPDYVFAMGRLSKITYLNSETSNITTYNDLSDNLKKMMKRNLMFWKLNATSLHVIFHSDTSFACKLELSSQIGGIMLVKEKHGNALSCTGSQLNVHA